MLDRTGGMGSTDLVEIAGLAPWAGAGPWRVYMSKTEPESVQDEETEEMAWGNAIEPFLVQWYSTQIGEPWTHHARGEHRVPSRIHPWLWASPDMSARGGTEFGEAKNVSSFMARDWDRESPDGIPHYVRAQVTIGMYCAAVTEWTVVAAIAGLPPRVYHVPYDPELAGLLVEAGYRFWHDHVLPLVPPEIDGSAACREYMRRKYPKDERELRDATPEENEIGHERAMAAQMMKASTARVYELDSKLLAACQDARGIKGLGWKITWKCGADGKRRSRFTGAGESDA